MIKFDYKIIQGDFTIQADGQLTVNGKIAIAQVKKNFIDMLNVLGDTGWQIVTDKSRGLTFHYDSIYPGDDDPINISYYYDILLTRQIK